MYRRFAQKWLLITLFFLFLGIFLVYLYIKQTGSEIVYRDLLKQSSPALIEGRTSRQHRKGIQKEILFPGNSERLRGRLTGARSELVLQHHEETTELVEELSEVICFVQEELYYLLPDGREAKRQPDGRLLVKNEDPHKESSWIDEKTLQLKPMQLLRYLEADHAKYYYKTDLFVGNMVHIARYDLPGHTIPDSIKGNKPLMTGVAISAELSLMGKDPSFKATKLQIMMPSKGRKP